MARSFQKIFNKMKTSAIYLAYALLLKLYILSTKKINMQTCMFIKQWIT